MSDQNSETRQSDGRSDLSDLRPEQVDALIKLSDCFERSENDVIAYDKLLASLKDMTGFSTCTIHLLDGHGIEMCLVASRDVPDTIPESILEATRHESMESGYMQPLLAKEPYRPTDHIACGDRLGTLDAGSIFQGEMIKVPLLSGGRLVGAMTIIKNDGSPTWFESHKLWLSIVGNHLGSIIDKRMDSAVHQSMALLQEREWMSKELNDRLLQYIGAIRISANRARQKWEAGDHADMGRCLRDIEEMANETYANIREEMVSLGFMRPSETDVLRRMREYLARFQRQWGIKIVFTVVDPVGALDHIQSTTAHLFRILQEALTNTRLHSNATQAEVSLETDGNVLRMLVVDNGIGFDVDRVPEEKTGLKIMTERAAQIGGTLQMISRAGDGTVVRVEVDLLDYRGGASSCTPQKRPQSTSAVAPSASETEQKLLDTLTPREREILVLLTDGLSNQEIASTLVISEKTVKKHLNNVFAKLDVTNRAQAAIYAIRAGLS